MSDLSRQSRQVSLVEQILVWKGMTWRNRLCRLVFHADTIAGAITDEGRNGEIRFHGVIGNTADGVQRLTKLLVAATAHPTFCYESGPCGYGLHRLLPKLGLIMLSSLQP